MGRTRDVQTFDEGRRRIRNDLIARGIDIDDAARWCAAWEAEASRQGIPCGAHYWDHAMRWIDEQLATAWRFRPRTR
jgi:hypothetical protein